MKKYSLTKNILGSKWLADGAIVSGDGSVFKCFRCDPLSSGTLEESFEGSKSDGIFAKIGELLTRLPNNFDGQILLSRRKVESALSGLETNLYFFEKTQRIESFSHSESLLNELKLSPSPLVQKDWQYLLSSFFGDEALDSRIPDLIWNSGIKGLIAKKR